MHVLALSVYFSVSWLVISKRFAYKHSLILGFLRPAETGKSRPRGAPTVFISHHNQNKSLSHREIYG